MESLAVVVTLIVLSLATLSFILGFFTVRTNHTIRLGTLFAWALLAGVAAFNMTPTLLIFLVPGYLLGGLSAYLLTR